ncbi:MAG TPA: molybdopterin biosynthesis protein MoeY, partial [Burkholderiaceae bacterium]
ASDTRIQVLGVDHSDTDVYDFDGRPTLLTLGFLLETMAVAASRFGARIVWQYVQQDEHRHLITVDVVEDKVEPDPLLGFVETRSVVRGRYRSDALDATRKQELERALGDDFAIHWFETPEAKKTVTLINAMATHIRLSIPEAFQTHQRILDWKRDRSPDGVPARAIGLDRMTLTSMQWVMKKWSRAHFMNRFLGGTVVPRLQMDHVPGKYCAAHFMVFRRNARVQAGPLELIAAGRKLQRFWLTATMHGLVMQPSLAPICFAYYARQGRRFTQDPLMIENASTLDEALREASGAVSSDELMFMGRIGTPVSGGQGARSVRKPLAELMHENTVTR